MNITFIGLGIMGSRMAKNLLKHDRQITVWNRSADAAEDLRTLGATIASSPADAVANADIVFSMLSRPDAVEQVFFGEHGALASMKEGTIWANSSTVNPSFSRQSAKEAEQHGVRFIDAPVAGSKAAAENGELVFFCGGDKEVIDTCRPFMEMMGSKAMHLGDHGQGSALKMLVNGMLAQSMAIFSETLMLGEKLGLDRDMLLSMLPNLPVIAPFTKHKVEGMRAGDYSDVHFPLEHMHKDIHLEAVTAFEVGQPMHMANAAKELFAAANGSGMGREDFSALYGYLRRNE